MNCVRVGMESVGIWGIGVGVRGIRWTAAVERIKKQTRKKGIRSNIVVMIDLGRPI